MRNSIKMVSSLFDQPLMTNRLSKVVEKSEWLVISHFDPNFILNAEIISNSIFDRSKVTNDGQ